jgi:hypothetical protein
VVVVATATMIATSSHASAQEPFTSKVRLDCTSTIASKVTSRDEVLFGVVALPTGTSLQASPHPTQPRSARHFAKYGLFVRRGDVVLVVPKELRDRFSIGWGRPDFRTSRLRIRNCGPATRWWVYAGGFGVREPACVDLHVVDRAHGDRRTVQIGVGVACPGQDPPPPPARRGASAN